MLGILKRGNVTQLLPSACNMVHVESCRIRKQAFYRISVGRLKSCCLSCLLLLQGMVKLLAANPDDKEVVREVARALKFMAAEKSLPEKAKRQGLAMLSKWSRSISYALHDKFEWNVNDSTVWQGLVGSMVVGMLTLLGVLRSVLK